MLTPFAHNAALIAIAAIMVCVGVSLVIDTWKRFKETGNEHREK